MSTLVHVPVEGDDRVRELHEHLHVARGVRIAACERAEEPGAEDAVIPGR